MIAIIDYKAGNLKSVQRACEAVGAEARITSEPGEIARAERLIFPGVGVAPSAMENLHAAGLDQALRETFAKGTPILGICLGTQIILEHSEEGDTPCLGLLEGRVVKFRPTDKTFKVPHMGWNALRIAQPHPLLEGISDGDEFYFVHSYHPSGLPESEIFGQTEYETTFTSAMGRDNLFATQFHPEKSGKFGLRLIENFTKWKP